METLTIDEPRSAALFPDAGTVFPGQVADLPSVSRAAVTTAVGSGALIAVTVALVANDLWPFALFGAFATLAVVGAGVARMRRNLQAHRLVRYAAARGLMFDTDAEDVAMPRVPICQLGERQSLGPALSGRVGDLEEAWAAQLHAVSRSHDPDESDNHYHYWLACTRLTGDLADQLAGIACQRRSLLTNVGESMGAGPFPVKVRTRHEEFDERYAVYVSADQEKGAVLDLLDVNLRRFLLEHHPMEWQLADGSLVVYRGGVGVSDGELDSLFESLVWLRAALESSLGDGRVEDDSGNALSGTTDRFEHMQPRTPWKFLLLVAVIMSGTFAVMASLALYLTLR